MTKKWMSILLAAMMSLSLMVPAFGSQLENSSYQSEKISADSLKEVTFEKTGEDGEFVYFTANLPITYDTIAESSVSATTPIPVVAALQTAVNKTAGKVALTIEIVTPTGKIKSAKCTFSQVTGDMGRDTHYNLSASNLLAKATIYINDMFDGLTANVKKGTVKVTVGTGTFSGPNSLSGTFGGVTGTIDLADC